jgi:hypothetical protein
VVKKSADGRGGRLIGKSADGSWVGSSVVEKSADERNWGMYRQQSQRLATSHSITG